MPAKLFRTPTRGSILVIALALTAGQVMQSTAKPASQPTVVSTKLHLQPIKVETVAATTEPSSALLTQGLDRRLLTTVSSGDLQQADPQMALQQGMPAAACPTGLDLAVSENAMIAVTVVAGCHPDERVVLKHAGLVITARTTLTGAIFTDLPALTPQATVEVIFKDGTRLESSIDVPESAKLRRFAVQWEGEDAFQVHGLENGADFDAPGDISEANPNTPAAGLPAVGGFLSVLGDSTTEQPLLAEVYTYPAEASAQPEVVVESAVTAATCGRELLGETLFSSGGKVVKSDLTAAMPGCDAIGGYLVLNNLVPELKIASSE